eukprot:TRINITY_DN6693_c0_g1_i2.p1 TRINITY_DN6693_c0_g1~~TRINITY_DN6693_c0_g1_i2.p1  ORF type:complete len:121 (+),score=38.72 TRINITY_DN6693_c0_g1_i2:393-755(+)
MASQGGANGIGLGQEIGSIEVGKKADLVIYDLKSLSLLPKTDPIGLLIYGRPNQAIDYVWVNGRLVMEGKKIVTIDQDRLREKLAERSKWLFERSDEEIGKMPTRAVIEAAYRDFWNLKK